MLSGIINLNCVGFIGSGVVLHIPSFFAELDALQAKGMFAWLFFAFTILPE
jgi:adenylosuccinate synthase